MYQWAIAYLDNRNCCLLICTLFVYLTRWEINMKKEEIKDEILKENAELKKEGIRLLENYAKAKHEKEILIKAIKIIINHQE